jgi:hypothetical protein
MKLLVLTAVTLIVVACSDNGTTIGSMGQTGGTNGGGAGGTESQSGSNSGAGLGAGDAAQGGSSNGGSSSAGSEGVPDAGDDGVGTAGAGGAAGTAGAAGVAGAASAAGAAGAAGAGSGGLGCTITGDCKSIVQNYTSRLAAARACDPSLGGQPQCPEQVLDACDCPVSVVSSDAREVQCYLEAREQVQARGCIACPAVAECPLPTKQCAGAVANPICQ